MEFFMWCSKYLKLGRITNLLLSGILLIWLSGCDMASGKAAVANLCKRDGGLHIYKTVHTPGYLRKEEGLACYSCFEQIGARHFKYIDIERTNSYDGRLFKGAGYYRIYISTQDDPRCQAYLEGVAREWFKKPQHYGLDPLQCFAVEKLTNRPLGYSYNEQFRRITTDQGQGLGVQEEIIRDDRSSEVLATNKNYIFTSVWTKRLDLSGRGGRQDAFCQEADYWHINSRKLIARVLSAGTKELGSEE